MIDELFLYDREKGLFKQILLASMVMQGRYHVSPSYGSDLNTDNLNRFITDSKYGLIDNSQKYPLAVCMPPTSRIINLNGSRWEEFTFNLFFLCQSFQTASGQIKSPDKNTNTSLHPQWYDWKDMKECAVSFLELLRRVVLTRSTADNQPLKSMMIFEMDKAIVRRYSNFNNDKLSGVGVYFILLLSTGNCELADYSSDSIESINIPSLIIHPAHKQ